MLIEQIGLTIWVVNKTNHPMFHIFRLAWIVVCCFCCFLSWQLYRMLDKKLQIAGEFPLPCTVPKIGWLLLCAQWSSNYPISILIWCLACLASEHLQLWLAALGTPKVWFATIARFGIFYHSSQEVNRDTSNWSSSMKTVSIHTDCPHWAMLNFLPGMVRISIENPLPHYNWQLCTTDPQCVRYQLTRWSTKPWRRNMTLSPRRQTLL